ncbi:MAG: hypothetical protein ACT4O1_06760 [Gemmatimonadota bacterium]
MPIDKYPTLRGRKQSVLSQSVARVHGHRFTDGIPVVLTAERNALVYYWGNLDSGGGSPSKLATTTSMST